MIATIANSMIASIPSPSSNALKIGPLRLNAYGLMIALGVIAGVWLLGRRMEKMGIGTRDDASAMSIWAVAAGVVGARLYHVVTSWQDGGFPGHPWKIFAIWQGGLGIPGGLLGGIAVAVWWLRKHKISVAGTMTAAAPALPLAQAIGRWGNWWNQELFGRPSTLPWALRIDLAHRPVNYENFTTFTPTFLYESLGNLGLCGLLLLIERRFRLRPGRLLAFYLAGYAFLRFFVEGLRIDDAHKGLGLRLNQWVALIVFIFAVGYLVVDHFRPHPEPEVLAAVDDESVLAGEATVVEADEVVSDAESDADLGSDSDTDVGSDSDTDVGADLGSDLETAGADSEPQTVARAEAASTNEPLDEEPESEPGEGEADSEPAAAAEHEATE